jgi:hypothetical protein
MVLKYPVFNKMSCVYIYIYLKKQKKNIFMHTTNILKTILNIFLEKKNIQSFKNVF